jgi:dolichol-phosphate mannosyltransferase
MIVVLVVGGMIMVMLGIIGEYVWRIFDQVRGKPNYIIRSVHNFEGREPSRRGHG